MKLAKFINGWWFNLIHSENFPQEPHDTQEGAEAASVLAAREIADSWKIS